VTAFDPNTGDQRARGARPALQVLAGVLIGVLLTTLILGMLMSRRAGSGASGPEAEFARAVDLSPLDRSAVHAEGRIKSFDSFAQEIVGAIVGPKRPDGLGADFLYLDLMLRPGDWAERDIIFVKNKPMRAEIARALTSAGVESARADAFVKSGRIAAPLLAGEGVERLKSRWSADIVRTAKFVDALDAALILRQPNVLSGHLAMIPPPSGRADEPWIPLTEVWSPAPQMRATGSRLDGASPELRTNLSRTWSGFVEAWRARDAARANTALAEFCSLLPHSAPALYPSRQRLMLESWYFKAGSVTWGWVIYLVALIFLLMGLIYRWEGARRAGIGVFLVGFTIHTVALAWRWYVSGRWPNSNMFEAVTTSVWLGTILAIVVEFAARRSPMRGLFALGAAAASMFGLMSAHFASPLSPSINNMMPILHDLWLYIHTNVIITSYALIAMAAVTAVIYVVVRLMGGPPDFARAGGAGALIEASGESGSGNGAALRPRARSIGEILDGATMVLMELSFVLLWAGLVMGAIWADHSWGRPWGWDPKEVFALNTFLVFLILVHVRLKARDKGLWTALLAAAGCGVMLFNWIVINFVISGLHSYA